MWWLTCSATCSCDWSEPESDEEFQFKVLIYVYAYRCMHISMKYLFFGVMVNTLYDMFTRMESDEEIPDEKFKVFTYVNIGVNPRGWWVNPINTHIYIYIYIFLKKKRLNSLAHSHLRLSVIRRPFATWRSTTRWSWTCWYLKQTKTISFALCSHKLYMHLTQLYHFYHKSG